MKMLSLLIPAFTAAVAFAQPPVNELKTFLNLTDAQVTSIQQSNRSTMQVNRELAEKMRTNRQNMKALLDQGNPDAAAMGRLVIEGRTYAKQIEESRAKARETALTFLSPEQKTKLKTLEEAMQLREEIGAAQRLNLLSAPAGGPGGPGTRGMRGRMGPGAAGRSGPHGR